MTVSDKLPALHGIMVALITPFTDDKTQIDAPRLKAHRNTLTELCVECAAGRVPVVSGTGSPSSDEAVDLARHAAQVGAAAVMVVPPFYDPLNVEELTELMAEIRDASQPPIPAASGLTLSPRRIAELSKVGVKYLKDTSGDVTTAEGTLNIFHGDFGSRGIAIIREITWS
ncbi:aldolase [Aspergillus heteromorphus CBS 117.55]|uniref:Aldolase n=1 Tax=Aspergillus heteromorphus CBS 117.55 TaxID=1448321 RepID=A0A317UV94_9EURO|nr:aldolase [Aspergillus heteromorphus CBS 117.55]PWY65973.1 aldolase [Aspergillus heteromorphus CBS 117.55]